MTTSILTDHKAASKEAALDRRLDHSANVNNIVGENIRAELARAGHGHKWVARKFGISNFEAKRWVNNRGVYFVCDVMLLSEHLNVPVERFFNGVR